MFTAMAISLFNTLESIATPSSVNAIGGLRSPILSELDITICDVQFFISAGVSWNMKSAGNRLRFRLTAWFSTRVSTRFLIFAIL
jgi:hypothetical protein